MEVKFNDHVFLLFFLLSLLPNIKNSLVHTYSQKLNVFD